MSFSVAASVFITKECTNFVHAIRIRDVVARKRFTTVLALLAITRAEELDWNV